MRELAQPTHQLLLYRLNHISVLYCIVGELTLQADACPHSHRLDGTTL